MSPRHGSCDARILPSEKPINVPPLLELRHASSLFLQKAWSAIDEPKRRSLSGTTPFCITVLISSVIAFGLPMVLVDRSLRDSVATWLRTRVPGSSASPVVLIAYWTATRPRTASLFARARITCGGRIDERLVISCRDQHAGLTLHMLQRRSLYRDSQGRRIGCQSCVWHADVSTNRRRRTQWNVAPTRCSSEGSCFFKFLAFAHCHLKVTRLLVSESVGLSLGPSCRPPQRIVWRHNRRSKNSVDVAEFMDRRTS